ncbi:MAG: fibronectin type III domain-containing protein [Candidatus Onthomorpha sp.]|nr:fibronectin type III domain-containing protein [Candidatus Onthomorpha sp.]
MRKILSLIVMAIALAIQLQAQYVLTVGDENSTTNNYGPIHSYYYNSFSEVIYLATELMPGDITAISYQYSASAQLIDPNPVIYMAEVERTSFSSNSDWDTTQLTEVYSGGSVTYSQGWVTISLTTPFSYSGNGHLLVAYNSSRTSISQSKYFKQTTTSDNKMIMNFDDDTPISVTNPGTGGEKQVYARRPNTRFTFSLGADFCYPPVSLVVSNVLSDEATISWSASDASSTTFGLEYKQASEDTWTVAASSITDTFYTLTGLVSLTDYDVRVYAVCPDENSAYTSGSFRTTPSQDDYIPIPYTETFDDPNNMTSWTTIASGNNNWYIGTAENCSTDEEGNPVAGGSLYVSNDNGVTASYTNNAVCRTYAYAYLSLQEDTRYGLQFDWKGGDDYSGQYIYDYLKVYLVPQDYELLPGSLPNESYALSDKLGKATTWTRESITLSDLTTGVYKIVFAWFNDNMYGAAAPVVDNFSISEMECLPVDSIRVVWTEGATSVSAEVSVYSDNDDATYELEYKTSAEEQWTQISGPSPFIIDDLLYGTQYFFRATSACSGGDYSVVSGEQFFYSPCSTIQLPYVQGFEDDFIDPDGVTSNKAAPLCWLNVNGGAVGYAFSRMESNALSGSGALYYAGSFSGITTSVFSDWLISPVVNLTGNEQFIYNIRLQTGSNTSVPKPTIDIMICDVSQTDVASMSDTSRFTLVRSINHDNLTATYEEVVSVLSSHVGPARIAIAVRNNTQSFYLDNLTIEAIPACPPIYSLSASAVSENSLYVSYYNENIGTSGVIIAYEDAAENLTFNPENATTQFVAQGAEMPVLISGLEPGTTYLIAAKQACEEATYCNAVTVTLPDAIVTLPYNQNFDDTEAEHGFVFTGAGANLWAVGTAQNNTTDENNNLTEDGRALYISNDNGATAAENVLSTAYATSPVISFGEALNYNLSFDYKVGGEDGYDYLDVFLVPYGAEVSNSYRILNHQSSASPSWQTFETTLPSSYSNGIYSLVFYWKNDGSESDSSLGAVIDNIRISGINCGLVNSVSATLVEASEGGNSSSITVNFVDDNPETSGVTYVLKYKHSQEANYTTVSGLSVSDFPYTIGNVVSGTSYTIAVASVCSDGVQTNFAQTNVIVPCSVNSLPWTENFEFNPFGDVSCWERKSGLLPSEGIVQSSSLTDGSRFDYNADDQNIVANIYSTSFHHWLISPSFDFGDGSTTYALSFSAMVQGYNGGNAQAASDDKFAVLISTDGGLSWDLANALIYVDADTDTEHNYSDLFDQWTTQIVQLVDNQGNPLSGIVKFAFYGESSENNADNNLFIDNVAISVWNDCLQPDNVAVSNVSTTSADVTFTTLGENTSWEYVLVEGDHADLSAATPVAFTSANHSLQITGLAPQTTYSLAVRSNCGTSYSDWSEIVVFTTLVELPIVTTLEATEVTHSAATLNGTITAGSEPITEQGFMYKSATAAEWTSVSATGETMSASLTDLVAETTYEYKAFATTESGTIEGEVMSFTTIATPIVAPTVVTLEAAEITHEAATLNGTVTTGSEAITAQGFMYKATTAADWTTVAAEGTAITATINGLTPETEYEYKAFATTESGTVEGNVVLFTTLANSGLNSAEGTVATMTVYPNPASERAIIAVSGVESGAKIVVSDMQGRIILSDDMTSETYELSVANMTSGVYYIRVIDGASIHTQKLIVE